MLKIWVFTSAQKTTPNPAILPPTPFWAGYDFHTTLANIDISIEW